MFVLWWSIDHKGVCDWRIFFIVFEYRSTPIYKGMYGLAQIKGCKLAYFLLCLNIASLLCHFVFMQFHQLPQVIRQHLQVHVLTILVDTLP
jgi:hypothetical protein